MTLVLDAGGLTALAGQRARLHELRLRGLWPAQVPSVVLTEALTGDHRRDFHTNRLLRACQVRDVDDRQAREAARLRTATGRAGTSSAVGALVIAFAGELPRAVVLTSDPTDLRALAEHTATAPASSRRSAPARVSTRRTRPAGQSARTRSGGAERERLRVHVVAA